MNKRTGRTRPITAADMGVFAGKSEEFLAVAKLALEAGMFNAAVGNAAPKLMPAVMSAAMIVGCI